MKREVLQSEVLELLKAQSEIQKDTREIGEKIVELLQEQNRLLSILVAPIISLQSKQLARATPEDRRKASKEALAAAKKAYKERNK